MPDLTVGHVAKCVGERIVNPYAIGERRRLMDRRGHKWVPEEHVPRRVDVQETRLGRGVDRLDGQRAAHDGAGRGQQLLQPTRRVDRRRQQQRARLGRQVLHAGHERTLQSGREREHVRQRPGVLVDGLQRRRKLRERQRVAGRLAKDPLSCTRREIRCALPQQCLRSRAIQRRDEQLVEPRADDRLSANGEQRHDRIRAQPPRHEREHVDRGHVQQLGIVCDEHQRPVRGRIRQEFERRERDAEGIGGFFVLQSERGEQAAPLDAAERVEPRQERCEQLV